jgi:hypothetical protein
MDQRRFRFVFYLLDGPGVELQTEGLGTESTEGSLRRSGRAAVGQRM